MIKNFFVGVVLVHLYVVLHPGMKCSKRERGPRTRHRSLRFVVLHCSWMDDVFASSFVVSVAINKIPYRRVLSRT